MLPKPIDILPQQPPFLFIDEYLELDENHCLGKYTFKEEEWAFKGHFPNKPIVPGVILIEAMAQALVSTVLFSTAKKENIPIEKVKNSFLSIFTCVDGVNFLDMAKPGDVIYILSHIKFQRFGKFEAGGDIYKIIGGKNKMVCTSKTISGQKLKLKGD